MPRTAPSVPASTRWPTRRCLGATSGGRRTIQAMSDGVSALLSYANKGTEFLFGTQNPLANTFALGALPVIVFFAALISILYYLGVMQLVIRWIGGGLEKLTGISRVEVVPSPSFQLALRPHARMLPSVMIRPNWR